MQKYAQIINEETQECSVGIGTNIAFYKRIGMRLAEVREEEDEEGGKRYILEKWLEEEQPEEVPEEEGGQNEEQEQENTSLTSD